MRAVPKQFRREVADRLVEARLRRGLSVCAVARNLPVSRVYLYRLESARSLPGAYLLVQLSELYRVNPRWILTGKKR